MTEKLPGTEPRMAATPRTPITPPLPTVQTGTRAMARASEEALLGTETLVCQELSSLKLKVLEQKGLWRLPRYQNTI